MSNVLVNETSLQNIASAIRAKNGSSDTYTPSEMATAIENIPSGGEKFSFINGGGILFPGNKTTIEDINHILSSIDTSSFTTYMNTFKQINSGTGIITQLDLTGFDTSNTTGMASMFATNNGLTQITNLNFNTKKVTSMQSMFYSCANITSLDLSSFETPALLWTDSMFAYCNNLSRIDMRNFDFTNLDSYSNMFGASASNGVPNNCLIIVKDATQKTWINTNFSRLTNVKTVAEL